MKVKIQIVGWNTQGPLSYYETNRKILVEYEQEHYNLNVFVKRITLAAVENSPGVSRAEVGRRVRCASSLPTAPPGSLCTLLFAQDAGQWELTGCPPCWPPEGSQWGAHAGSQGGRRVRSGFQSPAPPFQ